MKCPRCGKITRVPLEEAWYLDTKSPGGSAKGPLGRDAVEDFVRQGSIEPSTQVSSDGENWARASEFFDFSSVDPFPPRDDSAVGVMNEDDGALEALFSGDTNMALDSSATSTGVFMVSGQGKTRRYRSDKHSHGDPDTCTCPHCWTVFPLEDTFFVAKSPDLMGDSLLGPDAAQRFRPTSFTPDGLAIDPGGMPSSEMACPSCHLEVPRSLVEMKPTFFSIVGAPASGKSYYLASSNWELRRALNQDFGFSFTDAETTMNRFLYEYEETLFLAPDPNEYVSLRKTELQGELYSQVDFGGQVTRFPKPFIFNLKPLAHNPAHERGGRSIVLYDNAGEHFEPGMDNSLAPTTHLARARCLFFIFDPTKDPRFRAQIQSDDPQIRSGARLHRQDVVLSEMASRVRRDLGIRQDERVQTPLVVIVSKFDIWQSLLKLPLQVPPYIKSSKFPVSGLNINHIEDVSFSLRELLRNACPESVAAAEDFSSHVVYIPVSALGCSPTLTPEGMLGVRPGEIRPVWAPVPLLYALAIKERLILFAQNKAAGVLQGDESAAVANLVRDNGETLTCQLADGWTFNVPRRCAGSYLHHPDTLKPFRVPKLGRER